MHRNGTNVDMSENVEGLTLKEWKMFEEREKREISTMESNG